MPQISAFRGIRYDLGHVGSLSDVIAPPYDVIDPELQEQLYKKHPANVVRFTNHRRSSPYSMRVSILIVTACVSLCASMTVRGAGGDDVDFPVAVRYWGGPMVTIETWWHAPIVFDPTTDGVAKHSDFDAKYFFDTRDALDDSLKKRLRVKASEAGADQSHYYGHHVSVMSKPPLALRLEVDGATIVHWQDFGAASDNDPRAGSDPIDLLILPIDDPEPASLAASLKIITALKPRLVLPVGAPQSSLADAEEAIAAFIERCKAQFAVTNVSHNAHAVGGRDDVPPAAPVVLRLAPDPWRPTGELAGLLDRMERACAESQAVFEPLSARQMNFRPSNGTHTPRWNAEHMMGRELLFFTQIFSAQDPAFSSIDLNPAQMPDDYEPAHPEWSGAEEARQMERADAFVRRFAYLLDGLPLDEPAPGSRWTLRRLCEQMAAHYSEHTANVRAKFELADWPDE